MTRAGDYTQYEWDVETVEVYEDGCDVIDHSFQETAAECVAFIKSEKPEVGHRFDIALVLDDQDQRSWAYVDMETMTLPEYFENAYGRNTRKVPQKFHKELAKAVQ